MSRGRGARGLRPRGEGRGTSAAKRKLSKARKKMREGRHVDGVELVGRGEGLEEGMVREGIICDPV